MWLLLFGLAILLTWKGDGDPVEGAEDLYASITRGARLTDSPYNKKTGVVPGDPSDLAAQANATEDQYALARACSSEEGTSDNAIKVAVCWTMVNYAAKQGQSIADVLLHAKEPSHDGHFGTYKNIDASSSFYTTDKSGKPSAGDRYASTALDPYAGDLQIASGVLDGTYPDPTGGAIQFDRPKGEKNPAYTAHKRETAGLVVADVEGIDPNVIRFWVGG